LWLPGIQKSQAKDLPITTISAIGTVGPYHSDVDFISQNGSIRGPFEHVPVQPHQNSHLPDTLEPRCWPRTSHDV
jgi:hypothetical protein